MTTRNDFIATIAAKLREADELDQAINKCRSMGVSSWPCEQQAKQLRSDTSAHLVYADWLEEQGDPLAELIRLECEKRVHDAAKPSVRHGKSAWMNKYMRMWQRIQELQQQLNPFSDSVKVTWDRGLIAGVECNGHQCDEWGHHFFCDNSSPLSTFTNHPICTIRLRDWHGVERSLPQKPAEALPWLFKLELPARERWNDDEMNHCTMRQLQDLFGTLPNSKPCERCRGKWKSIEGYTTCEVWDDKLQRYFWQRCPACKGTGQGSKPRVRVEFYGETDINWWSHSVVETINIPDFNP